MRTSSDWKLVFGPPGTGKTTFGMNFVEAQLDAGAIPGKIAYIAFTRKAALEARSRAQEKFDFSKAALFWFRTIHSFCFVQLLMEPSMMMQKDHYAQLGDYLGIETQGSEMNEELYAASPVGDRMFFLDNLSRITQKSLRDVYEETIDDDLSYDQLVLLSKALARYKQKHKLIDFTDLLEKYLQEGLVPPLDALFVDEAQDLSRLQWEVVKKIGERVPEKYVAGDDDQAIYRWAGASVEDFLTLPGQKTVLSHSYRLPQNVWQQALGILDEISYRKTKEFVHNGDQGYVDWYFRPADLDLSQGDWLLLARNGYLLKEYERICEESGFPYESPSRKPLQSSALEAIRAWTELGKGQSISGKRLRIVRRFHGFKMKLIDNENIYTIDDLPVNYHHWFDCFDNISPTLREYFLDARSQGESLLKPRIKINTIHGVKGAEADHVAVITDLAARSYYHMQNNLDDEHRVFYVAVTRAKKGLNIIQPQSRLFYDL